MRTIVVAAVALVSLAAARPAAADYVETTVADGGILTGVVRFSGTPPTFPPLAVNKNRDVCGDTKPNEVLVLGADKGVRGSVVRIEDITKGKKPAGDLVIDNLKCLFVPHVAATMVGARARVKNSDAILHNTHGFLGKPTVFNVALPNSGQVVDITKRLTKTGAVRILCDAHPHMMAWLLVHDSPYITTTDDKGAFRIDGIPPGTYKVTMWHEGFRQKGTDKDGRPQYDEPVTVTREIQIGPKATATLDFELK